MATSTLPNPYKPLNIALYAPNSPTDVHTDTSVALISGRDWNNFKLLCFFFLKTSSTSSDRSMLCVPTQLISQGGWYALAQGSTIGGVQISFPTNEYGKIRIQSTSLSSLYLYRIWGIN